MKSLRTLCLSGLLAATLLGVFAVSASTPTAQARFRAYRQYYSSYRYYPARRYYYRSYYYKPYASYSGYRHHYCVYYPSRPRYVYYYNPYSRRYWGRYDLEASGYSKLAEADQRESLEEIAESAFPQPGAMPAVPESEDGQTMLRPPTDDLPTGEPPADTPAGGADAPN